MKYSMTCTCGDVMTVDAASREEAVEKLKGMMNPEMVSQHMAEKHPGEPVPTQEQVDQMVEQGTHEAPAEESTEAAPAETPAEAPMAEMPAAEAPAAGTETPAAPAENSQEDSGNNSNSGMPQ